MKQAGCARSGMSWGATLLYIMEGKYRCPIRYFIIFSQLHGFGCRLYCTLQGRVMIVLFQLTAT